MSAPVIVVPSGGIAVSEATFGTPFTPVTSNGIAVTIVPSGGIPVIFISVDGVLWPGGVAPGGGGGSIFLQSDFSATATSEAWAFW